ncbi:MAG TPA: KH domain-containing protein [Actinomycetota bacterium]|nr:KH domain-containing protein [Actinomycetota bacterium]
MSRELLDYVLPWLIDHPDELTIEEVESEDDQIIYEISVHPEDVGKIIGKRGRIIRAIRTLARASTTRERSVMVEVMD